MAREATVQSSLVVTRNNLTITAQPPALVLSVGGPCFENEQELSNVAEQILFGDLTSIGYVFFRNLGTEETITLTRGAGDGDQITALGPGQFALLPAGTGTIYGVASTGTPKLQIAAISQPPA